MPRFLRMKLRHTVICLTADSEIASIRVQVAAGEDPIRRAAQLLVRQDSRLYEVLFVFNGWPSHSELEPRQNESWRWTPFVGNFTDDYDIVNHSRFPVPTNQEQPK